MQKLSLTLTALMLTLSGSFASAATNPHTHTGHHRYCVLEKSSDKHKLIEKEDAKRLIESGKAVRAKGQCTAAHKGGHKHHAAQHADAGAGHKHHAHKVN